MAEVDVQRWMTVLRNAHAAGDEAAAMRAAARVKELQQPAQPDQFAGDDLLSDESMQQLASGERSTVVPTERASVADRAAKYGGEYLRGLERAGSELAQPSQDVPGVGTAEMLGTLATGMASPIPAALESAATGKPYREARDSYVYQPRTKSGRAMTGALGALVKPVGDAFALSGKAVGKALEPLGVSPQAAEEAGAATVDALGLATAVRSPTRNAPARALKREPGAIPSTEELKVATDAAYKRAEAAGVVIKPESFAKFADDASALLAKEHLNAELHPGTAAALTELTETAKRGAPLSLEEADQLRRIVRDAPRNRDDARMSRAVLMRLDAYLENLGGKDIAAGDAPQAMAALREARALNRRKANSAQFDELLRKAGIQASAKFTQAGEEHALRSEFKKLALNTRAMQKFTPAERAAIDKVATGGSVENAMRDLGKFDPLQGGMATAVSAIAGSGLGGLGFLMGGPEASALGLAIPVGGYVGRKIATRLTKRNVERAREAMIGRGSPRASTVPSKSNARAKEAAAVLPLLQSGTRGRE